MFHKHILTPIQTHTDACAGAWANPLAYVVISVTGHAPNPDMAAAQGLSTGTWSPLSMGILITSGEHQKQYTHIVYYHGCRAALTIIPALVLCLVGIRRYQRDAAAADKKDG